MKPKTVTAWKSEKANTRPVKSAIAISVTLSGCQTALHHLPSIDGGIWASNEKN
jgi:hypothetical protein